jgi:ATP-dependent Lhr-like helicase
MDSNETFLAQFHPLVGRWFEERIGQPTDLQMRAWPKIAAGEHLLITAPTGSGKTLAAFLWSLNQLITERWPTGHTTVLYISPLRALNYDIQRNLLGPLDELRYRFEEAGKVFPPIRVQTRSGDTSPSDRRQMLRHPPEILITTPESLNLLLSSKGGRSILTNLSTVILDEIHAVYGTKRGPYMMTAVDRLVRLSGEFQRIALSATIRPLEEVAKFVCGFQRVEESGSPRYRPRKVSVLSSDGRKEYHLDVSFPKGAADQEGWDSVWDPLVEQLKKIISRNRSTLIFVNSRRLCEMLTFKINQDEQEPIAYAHHGSLSLEIRTEVEQRLKAGGLKAIVATHSLELGIDIGSLDEVVLVQSPFSISSAIQRVGRSGHQVNHASRGHFFPTHPKDLLEAAVLAPAIRDHDVESFKMVHSPLDVLAQIIVSMAGVETWNIDNLFASLRESYPYHHLSRKEFDLVLEMLAGRYAGSRIRELRPLISIDRADNTVTARRGALQTLYLSGGVIPDRGYFHLRHQETNARIGELDEEFVWEAAVGNVFSLGSQNWRIERITHNDVFVFAAHPKAAAAPFWKGEENGRDFHFSQRIGDFLEEAEGCLDDPNFVQSLQQKNCLEAETAETLIEFLKRQKEATGSPLPHRHHLLIEFVAAGLGGTSQAILHTLWGGRINRPLAMALGAAWEDKFGYRLELYVSNDSIVLQLPHEISGEELLSLVESTHVESLLRNRLEGSGFFGARFRECAGRSLLLPKGKFNVRMPLWLSRLRSQKLLEAVMGYEDFPILLETWRTCIQDEFDLKNLKRLLAELEGGFISWTEVHTSHPSPFGQSDGWRQVNQYIYMDDSLKADKKSRLRESLLREVVFAPGLRPKVSRRMVEQFETKRKRLSPGYSPRTFREMVDWVMERVVIPKGEWDDLLAAVRRDHGTDPEILIEPDQGRLVRLHHPQAAESLVVAREMLPQVVNSIYGPERPVRIESLTAIPFPMEDLERRDKREPEESTPLLGQWLQFYGPVEVESIRKTFGIENERLRLALEDLIDSQKVIQGQLIADGAPDEICDTENFETLLRMARTEAIPSFEPLGIEWLPLFLADHQGIARPKGDIEGLCDSMEQLLCYPAGAGIWESEILPARITPYDPSWLDSLMQEGGLLWLGSEDHHVTFCFESDLDLLQEEVSSDETDGSATGSSMPLNGLAHLFQNGGRFDFSTLLRISKSGEMDLARQLWDEVWHGRISNDTFIALRRAILNRFRLSDAAAPKNAESLHHRRRRRVGLADKPKVPFSAGNWRLVPWPELSDDLLETEERRKDRVRLLLDRYGILFRELLQREWPAFHWANIFRALRIMELSGEVMSGIFFHGIPGPQFISHRAFRRLQQRLPEESIYWVNATDPASLCGLQIDSFHGSLPPRVGSTHLVYRGKDLVAVSKRYGKDLSIFSPHDDPDLPKTFVSMHRLLTRKFRPLRRIVVETINGENATESQYIPALRSAFDVSVDPQEVVLFRKTKKSS